MATDYVGAIDMPCSNYFLDRQGYKATHIICHGTAGPGTARSMASYFQSTQGGPNPVASHYIVDQIGDIAQLVREKDGAWANGSYSTGHATFWNENINPNNITISIEHIKPTNDNSDILTPAQFTASKKLIKDICKRNNIPMRAADATGGITGHFSIDPVNRARCPGPYDFNALFSYLNEDDMLDLTDANVAKYFRDGGNGTWICTNGVTLMGANLTFYRTYGGVALLGLPLSNELYPSTYPGTAIVPCERGMIVYDPKHLIDRTLLDSPSYLMHINSGIGRDLLVQTALAPLQAQIQALTAQLSALQNSNATLVDLQNRVAQIKMILGVK